MKKVLNYLLLVLTLLSGISVIVPLIGHYGGVAELSRAVYGTDEPLMGSWFFHYYLQPATGYLCAALLLAVLAKEFVVETLNGRLAINAIGFVAMSVFGGLYIAAMNLPGTG